MNKHQLKSDSIKMASEMVLGHSLSRLRTITNSQKSISTNKLEYELDIIEEYLKTYSIQMCKLVDNLD